MRQTVICAPRRTAIGSFGGGLKSVPVQDLAAAVVRDILERTHLDKTLIDDLILANCYPTMEAPALGRVVALDAGLPITTGGIQIDRRCGSGLQAIIYAVMQVASGGSDVVIAGGAESMSRAPFYTNENRWGVRGASIMLHDALARGRVTAGGKLFPVHGGMIETAENLRKEFDTSREDQDLLAVKSHMRAKEAQERGLFAEEIVPITVEGRKSTNIIAQDEHIREDSTIERLQKLRPIRLKQDADATVTAGNASGQNDGAAACIVTTQDIAEREGLEPLAALKSWSLVGVEPSKMGIGPVRATEKALERADLNLNAIDLIELNEAFAAQVLACTKVLGLSREDHKRINVNGSGISLGHPVGATGARILTSLLMEMSRRDVKYGLETMCIGGGQGIAAIFERVASP